MAKIVSNRQIIQRGVIRPQGFESRVITLELIIPTGVGSSDFAVTPPLAVAVLLINVDVWIWSGTPGSLNEGFYYLMVGGGIPSGAGDVILNWQPLIDNSQGFRRGVWLGGTEQHIRFTMNRVLTVEAQRIAVAVENQSGNAWRATWGLEISEVT